jgi:hypothetical protein
MHRFCDSITLCRSNCEVTELRCCQGSAWSALAVTCQKTGTQKMSDGRRILQGVPNGADSYISWQCTRCSRAETSSTRRPPRPRTGSSPSSWQRGNVTALSRDEKRKFLRTLSGVARQLALCAHLGHSKLTHSDHLLPLAAPLTFVGVNIACRALGAASSLACLLSARPTRAPLPASTLRLSGGSTSFAQPGGASTLARVRSLGRREQTRAMAKKADKVANDDPAQVSIALPLVDAWPSTAVIVRARAVASMQIAPDARLSLTQHEQQALVGPCRNYRQSQQGSEERSLRQQSLPSPLRRSHGNQRSQTLQTLGKWSRSRKAQQR